VGGVAFAVAASVLPLAAQAPRPADLERFYSAPSLVGTVPRSITWSADAKRVAFLWATDGTNFLQAYVARVGANGPDTPRAVTTFARPSLALAADTTPLRFTQWRTQRAALAAELDPGVTAVTWHPDGRHLLVTFRGDLYLVDTDAASPDAARLTETRAAENRTAFTTTRTDGVTRVAFVRDGDLHVAAVRIAPATAPRLDATVRVTSLARAAGAVEAFAWSPDGSRLLVQDTDRGDIRQRGIPDHLGDDTSMPMVRRAMPGEPAEVRRLGLVPATGGEIAWLPLGGARDDVFHGWQWSPDGTRVLVDVSDVFVKHRRLLIAEVGGGTNASPTVRALVEERDSANVSAEWQSAWAPDGRGVYFTSDRADDYHVWYAPVGGGALRAITRGPWAVFAFSVTPRGLFVTGNRGKPEERHLLAVRRERDEPVQATRSAGTHAAVVSPDGQWAVDLFSHDTIPPDLYAVDLTRGASPRRLTTSPHADFARYRFTAAQYVTFPSRADGATLHARLLLPPGRRPGARVPLIVGSVYSNTARNQWGGRNAHPLWGLDQVLLDRGFAILAVDVAGSSGHGTAFRRRIRLDYGGVDVEDLHTGVEWAIREGIADSARVGIWGSSYGGLLTTMSLFTKPHVFAAGVAGAPATNVWHALTGEQRVMLRPQEHMDAYARASSHTKADGLIGKLMLVHGMRDAVVLYKDSAWLTQYLLQLGKDVELVTLPDAGHGWDLEGLAQTRFAFRQLVRFFTTHLAP
jgi:dipeptidyl-peptidase 4